MQDVRPDQLRPDPCRRARGHRDTIRFGPGTGRLRRAEVHLTGRRFAPHRHDTYAIGVTLAGVQRFRYRGDGRVCLPGEVHVLHPDELHDGRPGTEDGFGYRILYVAPELLREALGSRPLPFVADPVQAQGPLTSPLVALLTRPDEGVDELAEAEMAVCVADALVAMARGHADDVGGTIDVRAVRLAREHLREHALGGPTSAAALEALTGCDRYTLARHFRRAYGTSPDRYRTLRRLDAVRTDIERGVPLATAAARAGFADQSHMSRQFKRTFGLTPGQWRAITRDSGDVWS